MTDSPANRLRALADGPAFAAPGAPIAAAARMIQQQGFQAMYLSGAAFSAGCLGVPDIGLFGLEELARQAALLTRHCRLPLIVDGDTGFGGPAAAQRAAIELQAAGAAAIQLEDQPASKRCGHLDGKQLASQDEMCERIAAVRRLKQCDLVLIARTDARAVEGLDAAVERAQAYLAAGAEWVFPESLQSEQEFREFAARVDAPLVANMTEFGKSPLLSVAQLDSLGYSAVLFPVTLLRAALRAMHDVLASITATGTQAEHVPQMFTRAELYALLDYDPQQPLAWSEHSDASPRETTSR